ncbi:hypothetical protein FP692_19915 [Salmonella enterica]|nr:hypothetical protein [Salmonella enterica]
MYSLRFIYHLNLIYVGGRFEIEFKNGKVKVISNIGICSSFYQTFKTLACIFDNFTLRFSFHTQSLKVPYGTKV